MKSAALSILILFGLAACSGPGGVAPKRGLMYEVPNPPSAVYVTEASQDIDIDAGAMGMLSMRGTSDATLAVSFSPTPEGVQVTATIQDLSASLSQPMGGSQTASESDLEGDLVFNLDPRGKGTVVSLPETKGMAEQLANPVAFVHELFPRLPGAAANPGDTWTDTIQYEIQTSQGQTASQSILTYTLQGDTTVAGQSLLHVTYEGDANVTGSAMQEGMEVVQTFSGDVSGMFLWDANRGLFVAGESSQDMSGTVEIPAAGIPPMSMTVRGSGTTRLQGN